MLKLSRKFSIEEYKEAEFDGWTVLGAGGGGCMFFPVVSPFSDDVLAFACDMTGTYFSYDHGKTWSIRCIKSRVDCITFDPVNEGVVYAGSSGLFRSKDNGHSWELIFPYPDDVAGEKFIGDEALHIYETKSNLWPGGKVQSITVNPSNPDNIFIGIGTGFQISYRGDELIIFESKDAGKSWTKVGKVNGQLFKKIYINEKGTSQKGQVFIITDIGFYKLDKNTARLIEFSLPETIKDVYQADAGFNPNTGESIFYTTANPRFDNNKFMSGVHKSIDYGHTWEELKGLDMDYYGPENGQFRKYRAISCSENDARQVYMSAWIFPEKKDNPQPLPNYQGIVVSNDAGETWDWSMKIGFEMPDNVECGWFETFFDTDWLATALHIAVSPSNPEQSFILTPGSIFLTDDGGKEWRQIYSQRFEGDTYYGNGCEVTGSHSIHFDPFDNNNQFITYSDNGLLKSKNKGKTWSRAAEGIPHNWMNCCYWIEFDPEISGKVWAVWSDSHNVPRETQYKNNHFFNHAYGGVCISTDSGEHWTVSNNGLPSEGAVPRSIVLDPNSKAGNRILYASINNAGVYKSTDDGNTWVQKNKGIMDNFHALKVLLVPDGTLYLLVNRALIGDDNRVLDGAIYKSVDGAQSWEKLILPAGVNNPNDIDYDGEGETVYIACWPKNDAGCDFKGGVYKTVDGGMSWDNIFDQDGYVYGVTTDKEQCGVLYIASFQNTVYRSDDGGGSWKLIKNYNFKWNHKVFLDPYDNKKLYIVTFGSSVWHGPNEVVS